jgi:BirA family biotin operon repressor/biotin-[acetyl-CoA-carboxylase] ligase
MGSTQDTALKLLAAGELDLPALIVADRQTAGRGRGGNQWQAEQGSLTFSLVVSAATAKELSTVDPRVSLVAASAVCQVLLDLAPGIACGIKWPNDVCIAGRKASGILVESPATDAQQPIVVVGVGMNVNNQVATLDADLADSAISLRDATGRQFDLTDVLLRFIEAFAAQCDELTSRAADLANRWRSLDLLAGRIVSIRQGNRAINGVCQCVEPTGELRVRTQSGDQLIASGEIAEIDPPLSRSAGA